MKTLHFFSKAMFLVTCITSGLYADVYLENNSGYDIVFKFAEPARILDQKFEIPLNKGQRFSLGDGNEVAHLSVKRSGFGSSLSSWVSIDIDKLRKETEEFLSKRTTNPNFNQHIAWSIFGSGLSWDAKVTGFLTPRK